MPRPIRATISAGALARNLRVARGHAGEAKIWAVLKANAYGHGLERAARALREADGFAVLDFQEAARLRAAGVTQPVLMLEGVFQPHDVAALAQYSLTPVIHHAGQVELLRAAAAPLDVYVKVNSGMNRLGFTREGLRASVPALREMKQVKGMTWMSHFADADGAGGVRGQLERFRQLTKDFTEDFTEDFSADLPRPCSLANSAALLRFPETRADWVRPGIMLYGCSPFGHASPDLRAAALGLQPAMTLSSQLIAIQRLHAGERIGYGFSYEAAGAMRIGVVACGYADGYPRHAPAGTPLLVNGRRARLVGRVSMDMITVDISDIADAGVGSPVTLWGEGLPADEVAAAAGTVSYELLCALAPRVPIVEAP